MEPIPKENQIQIEALRRGECGAAVYSNECDGPPMFTVTDGSFERNHVNFTREQVYALRDYLNTL